MDEEIVPPENEEAFIRALVESLHHDEVTVPREIAESTDFDRVLSWLEANNKSGSFAAEQGTTVINLGGKRPPGRAGLDMIKSFYIPGSVTKIGDNAFEKSGNLKNVNIPDFVTEIGIMAFAKCMSVESVIIPDNVTKIGFGAFSDCMLLTLAEVPDSVTEIGGMLFAGCVSLTSTVMPINPFALGPLDLDKGYGAFIGCDSLSELVVKGQRII